MMVPAGRRWKKKERVLSEKRKREKEREKEGEREKLIAWKKRIRRRGQGGKEEKVV